MLSESRSKAAGPFVAIEPKRLIARVHPLEIQALQDLDLTDRQIAAYFGVTVSVIEAIRNDAERSAIH